MENLNHSMFSAVAHKNLADAEKYFDEHLAQNDYYAAGEIRPGQWMGAGAERLELKEKVTREQFCALCENQNPPTGERLTQRSQREGQRRVFYDFTCSAPKSVSVLAVTLDDQRLIEAHEKAAKLAFRELETFAAARVRKRGSRTDRTTGNLVAAAFVHDSSRALDPQLRSHITDSSARLAAIEAMPARTQHDFLQTILQRGNHFLKRFRQRLAQSISTETTERSSHEIKPTEHQRQSTRHISV